MLSKACAASSIQKELERNGRRRRRERRRITKIRKLMQLLYHMSYQYIVEASNNYITFISNDVPPVG